MNKLFLICLIVVSYISLTAVNQVTIYNENFSLVRTSLELNLKKGLQSYYLENIPKTIEANSVIIKPLKDKFEIFSQNYEYDLANTDKILEKYIGKEITIITKSDSKFSGKLQFSDFDTIGLTDSTTGRLNLIKTKEIRNISLEKLPENFFLKPTLHWKLIAPKSGNYPLDLSYICGGMKWEATYNMVWNDEKNKLDINSWVTITNNSGMAFNDTKLKLVAGEVQKISQKMTREKGERLLQFSMEGTSAAPTFEEKAFHDFHLYTLSEKVSINNNQQKQIRLFPAVSVKANSKYEYKTYSEKVASKIEFINSKKEGLGVPLPKGIVKIYKLDAADNNLEFIGEDRINHTPKDEKVTLQTGYAFDLKGKTVVLDTRKISRKVTERDMKVTLKNHSEKEKKIAVIHHLNGDWKIYNENLSYKKKDANSIEFEKVLKPDETFEITWTERIEY
ncbi:MAG: DUF4139 domain-containing protein [Candidatus Cloacimonadota bacterium]|nr:MAG: DUF4139 domain-containing protein [Candidatus Cloacimonadota bacterium]